ncbi:MAG: hypothetical protein U0R80_14155 [Nocardioidaceae bacterium]
MWARLRHPSTPAAVAALVLLVAALRAPFVGLFPFPDESGLLIVASHWRDNGPQLYGHLFVDRPPGLLLFYAAADALGGLVAARVFGILLVAGLVVAAGRVGWLVGGRRSAIWSAAVAAGLACNPATGAQEINAELIGVPLIVAGAALALAALRPEGPPRRRALLLVAAGTAAGLAPTVKQNLVDGLVLVVVLVGVAAWQGRWGVRRTATSWGLLAAGAAAPWVLILLWMVVDGPGTRVLWDTLVQFRVRAGEVMASHPYTAVTERLAHLPVLAAASGLVLLVAVALWLLRRALTEPAVVAGVAMLAAELAGLALGGNYWAHYLIALIPGVVVLVASAARRGTRTWPLLAAVVFTVGSAVVASAGSVGAEAPLAPSHAKEEAVSSWLRAAQGSGDTALVTYGQAQLLEASGLRPGYPYIWSLPLRTFDPHLDRLVHDVRSSHRPDWVVEWLPVDSWGLDADGRAQRAIDAHYRPVATVCGVPVLLRSDLLRALPPVPAGCTTTPAP